MYKKLTNGAPSPHFYSPARCFVASHFGLWWLHLGCVMVVISEKKREREKLKKTYQRPKQRV